MTHWDYAHCLNCGDLHHLAEFDGGELCPPCREYDEEGLL